MDLLDKISSYIQLVIDRITHETYILIIFLFLRYGKISTNLRLYSQHIMFSLVFSVMSQVSIKEPHISSPLHLHQFYRVLPQV